MSEAMVEMENAEVVSNYSSHIGLIVENPYHALDVKKELCIKKEVDKNFFVVDGAVEIKEENCAGEASSTDQVFINACESVLNGMGFSFPNSIFSCSLPEGELNPNIELDHVPKKRKKILGRKKVRTFPLGKKSQLTTTTATSEHFASIECEADSDESLPDHSSSSQIRVRLSRNTVVRSWDKIQYCMFCTLGFTNLTKHFFYSHKNENEVKQIVSFPLNSCKRKQELEKLRNIGNYHHNCQVIRKGKGEIIPWRCPPEFVSAKNFVPCQHCLAFFQKKDLWKHNLACPHKKVTLVAPYRRLLAQSSLLLPPQVKIRDIFESEIFPKMLADDVTAEIKNDDLIRTYGEKLYEKHCNLPNLVTYTSQKMREIARFVKRVKEIDKSIKKLEDCIKSEKFTTVIAAVKNLAGYDPVRNSFITPSLILKVGHSLIKCAMIKKGFALHRNSNSDKCQCEYFLELMQLEYETQIFKQCPPLS